LIISRENKMSVCIRMIWNSPKERLYEILASQKEKSYLTLFEARVKVAQIYARKGYLSETETQYVKHPGFAKIMRQNFEIALVQLGIESSVSQHLDEIWLSNIAYQLLKNTIIVEGRRDGSLCVWNIEDATSSQIIPGHDAEIRAVIKLSDGHIATASMDSTIKIWDIGADKEIRNLVGHTGAVFALSQLRMTSTDRRLRIVSASADKTLRVWDITNLWEVGFVKRKVVEGHTDKVTTVIELSDGRIVSGSLDKTIRITDISPNVAGVYRIIPPMETVILLGHTDVVTQIIELWNGNIASSSGDMTVKIWTPQGKMINTATFHAGTTNLLQLSGLNSIGEVGTSPGHSTDNNNNSSRCWLIFGCGTLLGLWNHQTGEIRYLQGHQKEISSILQLDDGRLLTNSVDSVTFLRDLTLKGPDIVWRRSGIWSVFSMIQY
jgi:WD40 repeat protein